MISGHDISLGGVELTCSRFEDEEARTRQRRVRASLQTVETWRRPIRDIRPRTRVRMQDRSGHWSHWSDPILFIATTATASELTKSFRISEIHYDSTDLSQAEVRAGFSHADDFEFIELVNRSEKTLDLTGAEFVQAPLNSNPQGIQFLFAEGLITELAAGERILIVEDVEAFHFRYGDNLPIAGQWSGNLSNDGEQLTLLGDSLPIQQFAYSDDWYPVTDGDGPSLELIDTNNTDLAS